MTVLSKPDVTDTKWKLIQRVIAAFRSVKLEDGIGLNQAEGLDDYASQERLAKIRLLDETENWERISNESLNQCSCALSYFDQKGMQFHLPPYLIAELMHELKVDLIFHLTFIHDGNFSRFSLLNSEQRAVVRDYLELCRVECDDFILPLISTALSQYWNSPEHVGSEA